MNKDNHGEQKFKKAWNKALHFLAYRQRSKKEMEMYLRRKNLSDDMVEQVIDKLDDYGFLNDSMFAKDWVEQSVRRGRGSIRIKHELKEKGIDEALISEVLNQQDELSFESEYARASGLVENYLTSEYEKNDRKLAQKAALFLKRRGFPEDIVYSLIREYFF